MSGIDFVLETYQLNSYQNFYLEFSSKKFMQRKYYNIIYKNTPKSSGNSHFYRHIINIYTKIKKNNFLAIILSISIIFFGICGCSSEVEKPAIAGNMQTQNIYKNDTILQNIVELQVLGNSNEIEKYLTYSEAKYKIHSLYALASIADSASIKAMHKMLQSPDKNVRLAAAYAIGQLKMEESEAVLLQRYQSETEDFVKEEILISLGKCGTYQSCDFLTSINTKNNSILTGQGRAFYYLANRNITSDEMLRVAFNVLQDSEISNEVKLNFSFFLLTDNDWDLEIYYDIIKNELLTGNNIALLANLTQSLKYIKSKKSLELLKKILKSKSDYRIKISAIKALYSFSYLLTKDVIFEAVQNPNSHIAIVASEYILDKGNSIDVPKYIALSGQINSIKARSNMYQAALFYSTNKKTITDKIISGYNVTSNVYEKACILNALSAAPEMYKFVKDITFSTDETIISTAGIKAICQMRMHPKFDKIAAQVKAQTGEDLDLEFKLIFKEAIASGDMAMVYYSSKIINQFNENFFNEFDNTYFITNIFNEIKIPQDILAYNELRKTSLKNISTTDYANKYTVEKYTPNWKYICSIASNQKVRVETNKGNFDIQLDVNTNPVTVGIFLSLIKENYYSHTYFYKIFPNYGVFSSSKRGDSWATKNIAFANEFSNKNFTEGSVAMENLSDNFLSPSWLVSTNQNTCLSDDYTIFGQVTRGIDVVHQLEIGDVIEYIKII